jgi:hypothetical protein
MAWSGRPESLGGNIGTAPDTVSWSAKCLDVFGRGTDSTLQHWWWDVFRGCASLRLASGAIASLASMPGKCPCWAYNRSRARQ